MIKLTQPLAYSPKFLADILFRKDQRARLFLELKLENQVELFRSVTKHVKQDIAVKIDDKHLVSLLEQLDPDEATDVLQLVGKKKRERVLGMLSQTLKDALSLLLEFDAHTAAGLMTLDYVTVNAHDSFIDVAKKFRIHEQKTGRPPVILVMHGQELAGFLPGYELAFAEGSTDINSRIKKIASISYTATHSEVLRLFSKNKHRYVVVRNDAGNIMGIIYSDDVLRLMQEKQASSLYDFAGISQEESVTDIAAKKIQHRYKWLLLNLATSFFAAFAVSMFEDTLTQVVLLAVYMPIVAGMGGNAATQTLAVLVRGIALKQIELKTGMRALKNEIIAGFVNGVINGVLVAAIVYGLNRDVRLSIVLGVAMVVNLVVAAAFGTLIPLMLSKAGKDPATSATVFITTATDVLGFIVFLGLGTWLLI